MDPVYGDMEIQMLLTTFAAIRYYYDTTLDQTINMDNNKRLQIGQTKSDWCEIKGGVPQGTKIGVLLFLCMINDLQPSPN